MDLFHHAKSIRLKSHHNKYLLAEEDEESVTQGRKGSSKTARWAVELTSDPNFIRLKSSFGKYLTASNAPFLLGMTGLKVTQTLPRKATDSSTEWEPVKDGFQVKLRTRYGNFLRANGGLPPWRNSVTHDIPHRTHTQEWVLWDVDVLEIQVRPDSPKLILENPEIKGSARLQSADSFGDSSVDSFRRGLDDGRKLNVEKLEIKESGRFESADSFGDSSVDSFRRGLDDGQKLNVEKLEIKESGRFESVDSFGDSSVDSFGDSSRRVLDDGRIIYYSIADDNGDVEDGIEGESFSFKGHGVEELTHKLKEETGIDDIIVCTRSPLNGQLYPLRLRLPPNNTTMHVVVVPSSSRMGRGFTAPGAV